MGKREYRDLDIIDLLPVRLEELISENTGRSRDYSFEDIRELAQELRKQQIELGLQKGALNRAQQELNHTIHSRTIELVQISEELIDELLDHKETLGLLKESEEFNRSLMEYASHPIVVINSDNSIRCVNPAFENLTGFSLSDVRGKKPPFPYWPAEKRQEYYENYMDENARHLERLFRRKDGELFWVELSSAPVEENGTVKYRICTWLDVTERKRFEEALKLSEEKFSKAFHASPVPMTIATLREGRFLDANNSFLEAIGCARAEVIGHLSSELMLWPDDSRERIARLIQEKGKITNEEVSFTSRSGQVSQVLFSAEKITLGDRECLLSAANDITEHRKTEEALRASDEFNNALLENVPDQIIVFNPDTSVRYVNPAFVEKNGWTRDEVIGIKAPYPWWPEEEREKMSARFKLAMQGERGRGEAFTRKKSGERYWIAFSYASVNSGGKQQYLLSTATDVTEQKLAEQELRESEGHFRALTSKFPVPIFVISDKHEIEYVNEAFTAVFGYTLKDFRKKGDWLNMAFPEEEYRNEVMSSWRAAEEKAAKENRSPEPMECRVTVKDGGVRNVEMSETVVGIRKVMVLNDVTECRKAEEDMKQGLERVQTALQGAIDAAAKMVELRDPYTAGHQQKVAKLAMAIAREMNLSDEQVKYLGMAATVHDIGKINVPAEILSRTGKLTDLEFQMMRMHVQGSYDILKNIEFPWPVAEVVLQHHERMDCSGYPQGLKGDQIMLEARILALADTVEAMSAHRPYRPALGVGEALEEISKNKGKLYDTDVVEACINLILGKGFRLDE